MLFSFHHDWEIREPTEISNLELWESGTSHDTIPFQEKQTASFRS